DLDSTIAAARAPVILSYIRTMWAYAASMKPAPIPRVREILSTTTLCALNWPGIHLKLGDTHPTRCTTIGGRYWRIIFRMTLLSSSTGEVTPVGSVFA